MYVVMSFIHYSARIQLHRVMVHHVRLSDPHAGTRPLNASLTGSIINSWKQETGIGLVCPSLCRPETQNDVLFFRYFSFLLFLVECNCLCVLRLVSSPSAGSRHENAPRLNLCAGYAVNNERRSKQKWPPQ